MKKALSLILVAVMVLTLLAGCGSGPADATTEAPVQSGDSGETSGNDGTTADEQNGEEPAGPITVTVGISQDFSDMSPFGGQSGGKQYYKWLIYGYLVLADQSAVYHNVLAKRVEYVDNLTLDVEIYDYIHDWAGNAITADDVMYSFQMAKDSGNFTGQGPAFIDHMEKLDEYTVRFYFTADALGGTITYITNVPITSRKAYEESDDNMAVHIIGCGRYKITDFVAGSTLTLEKVENFWQEDDLYDLDQLASYPDKIIYKYIPEASQMSIALETGIIDCAGSVSGTEITRFIDDNNNANAGYTLGVMEPTQVTVLLFNCTEGSLFDNEALRQAVCYAINTPGIVQAVLSGRGYACTTFGSSAFPDASDTWSVEDYYNYNLELAKEKMKEAGYDPDGSLKVRLVVDGNANRGKAAEIIQNSLKAIGIEVTINAYETALFNTYKNEQDEWEMLIDLKNGSGYIPNCWRSCFDATAFSNGLTVNFAQDDQLQELVIAAKSPDTYSEETIEAFHQYLKERAYGYGLYVAYDYAVALDSIENIFINSSNYICPGAFTYASDFVGVTK